MIKGNIDYSARSHTDFDVESLNEAKFRNASAGADRQQEINAVCKAVSDLILSGQATAGLVHLVDNYACDAHPKQKEELARKVAGMLGGLKAADIAPAVEAMSMDQALMLLKLSYKAMEHPELTNCAILLSMHKQIVARHGTALISRVITDRRRA